MSDSVRPHRRQPTRLPCPWDSPGNNTGVGRHFLLQCMKVKGESEVGQSCLTLSDPIDCSLPGSSVHGTLKSQFYPAPDFERIISLTLSLLYGPILTSEHDYQENRSFNDMDLFIASLKW